MRRSTRRSRLIVREGLTGAAAAARPRASSSICGAPFIEERAGARSRPARRCDRRSARLRRRRAQICSIASIWARIDSSETDEEEGADEGDEQSQTTNPARTARPAESADSERDGERPRPRPTNCRKATPKPSMRRWRYVRRRRDGRFRNGGRTAGGRGTQPQRAARSGLSGLHRRNSTRSVAAEASVRCRRNSTGCAAISTSSCSHLQGVVARLANRLQRLLLAQQNRAWEFDLEEGMLDPARLPRVIIDPCIRFPSSGRRTPISATRS